MIQYLICFILIGWSHSATAATPQWMISGSSDALRVLTTQFRHRQQLQPLFSTAEQAVLTRKRKSDLAATLIFKASKSGESELVSDLERLRKFIHRKHLRARIDENDTIRLKQTDPLSREQWYLNRSEIQLKKYTTRFDSIEIRGEPNETIDLKDPMGPFPDVVVAVLDSGVDIEHPDLKSSILRKTSECAALEAYQRCQKETPFSNCKEEFGKVDSDGNGYPLDCSGWSTLESEDGENGSKGSEVVTDDIGHGTHVAGLIAAQQNSIGVRGVAPFAKILPVRVIGEDPSSGSGGVLGWNEANTVVSQVARGMVYAIASKAQVINLSLGWNGRSDSPVMRELVDLARSQGIFVVAAAGNDGTEALAYPCHYSNVICVGAHDHTGYLADFSNYGNGVDIAAPGFWILSTIPHEDTGEFFNEYAGYEFKEGTSMATPIVSGAIASLLQSRVPVNEVEARLYLGARRDDKTGSKLLSGRLDIQRALETPFKPYLKPTQKGVYPSILEGEQSSVFKISLEFENIGASSFAPASVRLKKTKTAFSHRYEVPDTTFPLTRGQNGVYQVEVTIRALSDRIPSEIPLVAETSIGGERQTFLIPVLVSTWLQGDALPARAQVLSVIQGTLMSNADLYQIERKDGKPGLDYLAVIQSSEKKFKFQVLEEKNGGYFAHEPFEREYPRPVGIRLRQRLDVSLDGKSDLFLTFYSPRERNDPFPTFFLDYLDYQGREVLPQAKIDGSKQLVSLFKMDDFRWVKFGSRLTPLWIDLGAIAPEEVEPAFDPWLNPFPELKKSLRIYYHDPSSETGVRTLSTPALNDWIPQYMLEGEKQGSASLLASTTLNLLARYSVIRIDSVLNPKESVSVQEFVPYPRINLQIPTLFPLVRANPAEPESVALNYRIGDPDQRFTVMVADPRAHVSLKETRIRAQFPGDIVFKGIAAYSMTNQVAAFAQGLYDIYYTESGLEKPLSTSLRRYTFLPSTIFERQFYPGIASTNGSPTPAIRIPDGMGAYPGSELIIPDQTESAGALIRPAKFRFLTDEKCEELSAKPSEGSAPTEAVYFCDGKWVRIPYVY